MSNKQNDHENKTGTDRRTAPWPRPFSGIAIALLLLTSIEATLHGDAFLYRFRSVFAAGRAIDKILAYEANPTSLLFLGNSRVDNGISPAIFQKEAGLGAFNLGLPGAEACNIEGVVKRLVSHGIFSQNRTHKVIFGLDEGFFRRTGGLGYEVFLDDRSRLIENGRYRDWLRSVFRLWGYIDSFRTLQEPAKLVQAMKASISEVESWGGSARDTAGFRAADEVANQGKEQIDAQTAKTYKSPDIQVVECFWSTVDRLQATGVKVSVFFTPALHTRNAFVTEKSIYHQMRGEFARRGIDILETDHDSIAESRLFANPGHLNRRGANEFSVMLSRQLNERIKNDNH